MKIFAARQKAYTDPYQKNLTSEILQLIPVEQSALPVIVVQYHPEKIKQLLIVYGTNWSGCCPLSIACVHLNENTFMDHVSFHEFNVSERMPPIVQSGSSAIREVACLCSYFFWVWCLSVLRFVLPDWFPLVKNDKHTFPLRCCSTTKIHYPISVKQFKISENGYIWHMQNYYIQIIEASVHTEYFLQILALFDSSGYPENTLANWFSFTAARYFLPHKQRIIQFIHWNRCCIVK